MLFKYFKWPLLFSILAVAGGYALMGPQGAIIILILGVLEISLSFDNAVVNATVLRDMDAVWRARFIRYGIPIAVFGMRFVFPVLIVSVVAALDPITVLNMAILDPAKYAAILTSAHQEISAFGGAFLCMVFLKFFLDEEKDVHWVSMIEKPLTRIGKMDSIQIAIALVIVMLVSTVAEDSLSFMEAGMWGVVAYVLSDGIGAFIGDPTESATGPVVRSGLAGFIYLEVLDASFSFDGVIGAFALSNNVFVIMAGLGIGALCVRELTIMLVDRGTLQEFRYLEHGAFWAIGALSTIMFLDVFTEVPHVVTGFIGVGAIALALFSSVISNRADAKSSAHS